MSSFDFEREFYETEGFRIIIEDPETFPLGVDSYKLRHGGKAVDRNDPNFGMLLANRIYETIGVTVGFYITGLEEESVEPFIRALRSYSLQ